MELIIKLKELRTTVIFAVVGLLAGYLYWYFIGCNSGSCTIFSSAFLSTLYGGILGGLVGNSFKSGKPKQTNTLNQ